MTLPDIYLHPPCYSVDGKYVATISIILTKSAFSLKMIKLVDKLVKQLRVMSALINTEIRVLHLLLYELCNHSYIAMIIIIGIWILLKYLGYDSSYWGSNFYRHISSYKN